MAKTVVQVSFDKDLLTQLNKVSRKERKTRAELVREACRHYLKEKNTEELDRLYEEGYRRIPETTEMADSQMSMLKDVWPKESW